MAENYTPTGATAAAVERFTAAEAATGTNGTMFRTLVTELADRTRFLATTGLIAFPASQVASADANTLDDYEEGTWTPTITLGGGSATYTSQVGTYKKIGRTVHLRGRIVINVATTPSGALAVAGLPFTSNASSDGKVAAFVITSFAATATQPVMGNVDAGAATIGLYKLVTGSVAALGDDFANSAVISFSVTYQV